MPPSSQKLDLTIRYAFMSSRFNPNPSKPRKPKGSAPKIRPSSFRPHVLAIHRLKNWHSPHSAKIRVARRDRFSTATLLAHDKVLDAALGTGSHSNYGGGLARFHEFCDSEDIPENDRMPASEELIAMFIASWAGRISRSAVDTWVSAVRAWHIVHGASWLMDDHLRFVKNGVTNLVPESSTRAPRPPVTIPHISALRENLSLNNTFDSAVLACAECAFFGCNRLGELLPTSHISYDPSKFATRTAISFDSDPAGNNFYAIKAPWTKTTGYAGATLLVSQQDSLNPVASMEHHLIINKSVPSSSPLFSFQTASVGSATGVLVLLHIRDRLLGGDAAAASRSPFAAGLGGRQAQQDSPFPAGFVGR
ncbi:hypothetical protein C8J57DRAFT_1214864 [Mycena rebaudengoi]|nr:hypothetical protein C8J57DRAFT_1214864 [Mycena rebaudengoi]